MLRSDRGIAGFVSFIVHAWMHVFGGLVNVGEWDMVRLHEPHSTPMDSLRVTPPDASDVVDTYAGPDVVAEHQSDLGIGAHAAGGKGVVDSSSSSSVDVVCDMWMQARLSGVALPDTASGVAMPDTASGGMVMGSERQTSRQTQVGRLEGWLPELVLALMDSGAYDNVCPVRFADDVVLVEPVEKHSVVAANGNAIEHFGSRRVQFVLWDGRPFVTTLQVMDVNRVILSVSCLRKAGFHAGFDDHPFVQLGDEKTPLLPVHGLYYLPLRRFPAKPLQSCIMKVFQQMQVAVDQGRDRVFAMEDDVRFVFFELTSCPTSQLTAWFDSRGYATTRFVVGEGGQFDLQRLRACFTQIACLVEAGKQVVVWLAPPHAAWSPWQRMNNARATPAVAAEHVRLTKRCTVLLDTVAKLFCDEKLKSGKTLHGVLEWPKASDAWGLDSLQRIGKVLSCTFHYDSCSFGVEVGGVAIKRSWRVATDLRVLEPLSQHVCQGVHAHAECRSPTTSLSSLQCLPFVMLVGKLLTCQVPLLPVGWDGYDDDNFGLGEGATSAGSGLVRDESQAPAEELPGPAPVPVDEEIVKVDYPVVRTLPLVEPPAAEQQHSHRLTHLPYAAWCQECVMAKGRDSMHRSVARQSTTETPLVEVDYLYMTTEQPEDDMAVVLIAVARPSNFGFACMARTKGRQDTLQAHLLVRFLQEAGLGGDIRLRNDSEPAVANVCEQVAKLRGSAGTIVEETVKDSHSSLGGAERFAQALAGQVRCLRFSFQKRWGRDVAVKDPLFPWMICHATWLLNRFQVHTGFKQTPFATVYRYDYRHPVLEFGQTVLMRHSMALHQPKLAPRWALGIWLGRATLSDAHVAGSPAGVIFSRTVKPMPDEPEASLFEDMVWTPWRLHGVEVDAPGAAADQLMQPEPQQQLRGGSLTERGLRRNQFWRERGRTEGCRGCHDTAKGTKHSASCEREWADWERVVRQRVSEEPAQPGVPGVLPPPAPASAPAPDIHDPATAEQARRLTEGDLPMPDIASDAAPTMKRTRDEDMDAEVAADEIEARGDDSAHEDGMLDTIFAVVMKPMSPWKDTVTGEVLDEEATLKGMSAERAVHRKHGTISPTTWTKARALPDARFVTTGWVLRQKPGGRVKARLVVTEVNHGGWRDAFAATPSTLGLRLAMWIAATKGWTAGLADLIAAFLNARLPAHWNVILIPPKTEDVEDGLLGELWRMHSAIYGLRESPHLWQEHFATKVGYIGWRRLKSEPQMFVYGACQAVMCVHVDDIFLAAPGLEFETRIQEIKDIFDMKDEVVLQEGVWHRFLGRELRRTVDGFDMRIPPGYFAKLVHELDLDHARAVQTPFTSATAEPDEAVLGEEQHALYRRTVGATMWAIAERPDVAFPVKERARKAIRPTVSDLVALKRLVKYLGGTEDMVLHLRTEGMDVNVIQAISDASWASSDDMRSTSGGSVWLGGWLAAAWSRTQATVTMSSCEAELLALNLAACEGKFSQSVLREIVGSCDTGASGSGDGGDIEVQIFTDSSACLGLLHKRGLGRARHMSVKQIWLQDELRAGRLSAHYLPGDENVSDMLTKALPRARFEELRLKFGVDASNAEASVSSTTRRRGGSASSTQGILCVSSKPLGDFVDDDDENGL